MSDLAAEVQVSPDYLERLFQAHLGQSITQCIQQARLQRAAELLVTSFRSVGEIARHVGYRRVSYFDRVFRAQYGVSPQAYRRRAEQKCGR